MIYDTFDSVIMRTNIICIVIQDQQVQRNITTIEVVYPSGTHRKDVEPGQLEYLITVAGGENDHVLEKVTFFDSEGRVLYTHNDITQ